MKKLILITKNETVSQVKAYHILRIDSQLFFTENCQTEEMKVEKNFHTYFIEKFSCHDRFLLIIL